jgi:putative Ca2+/H+ antiporter (TMEM165/GDT1 family)
MNWSALLSTFGLVFLAELGDKTQLAVVTQTCKYRCPLPVFLGASIALTAVTALGVVGGRVLGCLIPAATIRTIAALAFVVMGGLIWRESVRMSHDVVAGEDESDCGSDPLSAAAWHKVWDWRAFGTTLTLLFLAELGDKTQLAIVGLTCKPSTPWAVFAGGALALTGVTALGVIGGQQLCKLLPERVLLKISAVVFVVMGGLMGLGIL